MDVGLFGKLPSHGDFLRRRAPDAFVEVWDAWLQECMAASRASLDEGWLDVYLTSPAWRFACAPGPLGRATFVGLLVPSVDRVGRYFPLTLLAELPEGVDPIRAATEAAGFFETAERLVIDTLAAPTVDFEAFDRRVHALGDLLAGMGRPRPPLLDASGDDVLGADAAKGWQFPIGSPQELAPVLTDLLRQRLAARYRPLTLWWTEGSSRVEPSCLIAKGLLDPATFGALLDGSWGRHRWRSVPVRAEAVPALALPTPAAAPYCLRSAAASDVGLVRAVNQDAFVERPEIGLWAVADGLGGHTAGEVASRMVCDALADFAPAPSLEDTIEAVRQRLQQVNQHLRHGATASSRGGLTGSTVVMLIVRESRCAVLWAGDSRAYRWRSGRLERLTTDHAPAESAVAGRQETHAVTRAVGAEDRLVLDVRHDEVRTGDRFLLCSDGLSRTVAEQDVQSWLGEDVRLAVHGLVRASLDAGAPDNVTVLVVEACAEGP